ncbi:MAG: DUF4465 domain-containing protein [Bacteroidetes bacterium]|uniref:DUF4465 domain-containing protein n=1 Tax=Candidatus Cryptobacteroides merdavium TaxID=2840769 RepID=A0A9D9EG63_9BACT|nr:DUF4465 domain-containing protein [Candidatus Cryptobacteroides merdavium]
MKKIFPLIVTSMLVVSCFNGTGYEASYNMVATFDGMDEAFASDTAIAVPAFSYGPLAFYNAIQESETVSAPDETKGGWIISRSFYPIEILLNHINGGSDTGDTGDGAETLATDWESKLTPYCASDTTDASRNVGDGTFVVFHDCQSMPEHDVAFLQSSIGTCTLISLSVNTTADVARYFRTEAAPGDYLNVKVTGYLNGNSTGTVEYCLADYRSGSLDSLRTEWKTLNLSRLGNVQYVDFEIDAQLDNADAAGRDLRYFCMDNLAASIYVKQ